MMTSEQLFTIVGAIVAVLMQVLIAPHIGLFGAVPNFMVAFALVCAAVRGRQFGCVMPFVLGLLFDLMSGGPVGAMAFSLTAFSFATSRFFAATDNDTVFMSIVALAGGLLLVELSYGVFMLLFGYPAGLIEALAYRTVPAFVYDFVISLVALPVVRRFVRPSGPLQPGMAQLR